MTVSYRETQKHQTINETIAQKEKISGQENTNMNEEIQEQEIITPPVDPLNVKVGIEQPKLQPKKVCISDCKLEEVAKDGKVIGSKVVFYCDHPDSEAPLLVSSIKHQKNDKLQESGSWYNLDKDGKIAKSSALASLLDFVGAETINDLKDKELSTVYDQKGYLCLKAY